MTIRKKSTARKIEIDISGPQGNAFVLLGYARSYGRQLGFDKQKIEEISAEMKEDDYEHLIKTFDKYFGDYIDLVR